MHKIVTVAYLFTVAVGGCSSGPAMQMPDMKMVPPPPPLYIGDNVAAGVPADEGCLNTRKDPAAPTMDTTVMGVIKDFQDSNIVTGAVVSVYLTADDVSKKMPVAMSTPSDGNGKYTLVVPKGHYRVIMGNTGGKAISNGNPVDTIDTYEFNVRFDYASPTAVKVSTREAIPGLVSVIPDLTLGVLAGSVRDCQNKETGGAQVTVSGTSVFYDSPSLVFYFVKVNGSTLPSRTQHWTGGVGVFAALNVPPGVATVTANGIVGSATSLAPIGSATVPVQAGAITIVDILPTPAP